MVESKHFSRRVYLIDTVFNPKKTEENKGVAIHSLEEYASEVTYRILGDLMEENKGNSKAWYFNILRDNTPLSTQLAYGLMGRCTRKISPKIMPGVPTELCDWYNIYQKATNTLVVLADADTLKIMGYQLAYWLVTKHDVDPERVKVNENHNFFFNASTGKIEEIPKFSINGEQEMRYKDLANKISYNQARPA